MTADLIPVDPEPLSGLRLVSVRPFERRHEGLDLFEVQTLGRHFERGGHDRPSAREQHTAIRQ